MLAYWKVYSQPCIGGQQFRTITSNIGGNNSSVDAPIVLLASLNTCMLYSITETV